jgi:hypothetical protein
MDDADGLDEQGGEDEQERDSRRISIGNQRPR